MLGALVQNLREGTFSEGGRPLACSFVFELLESLEDIVKAVVGSSRVVDVGSDELVLKL